MRSKQISFAQVLKSKGKTQQKSTPNYQSLLEMMERYEQAPYEDFRLCLGPNSVYNKSKEESFRGMTSRAINNNQSEIFDSWIQKQSLVNNKQNNVKLMINSKNYQTDREGKQIKKIVLTSRGKEIREPLKSVAQLVRKIDITESHNTTNYFKSEPKNLDFKNTQKQQKMKVNQQDFKHNNQKKQIDFRNFKDQPIQINLKLPNQIQKINAKPYIEQPSVMKKNNHNTNDHLQKLIAKTEYIHLQIAQIAQKYVDNQIQSQKMQDSLLIENSLKKPATKQVNLELSQFSQFNRDENKKRQQTQRWEAAKNKINNYMRKIIQEEPHGLVVEQNLPHFKEQKPLLVEKQAGYSFSQEIVHIQPLEQEIPILNIPTVPKIPEIPEIQSERFSKQDEPLIPEGNSIPSIESIKIQYYASPNRKNECQQFPCQIEARIINSSLMLSDNLKESPSSQSSQEKPMTKKDSGQSNHQCVSLSFTQEKPEIMIKIPINYQEDPKQFEIQTVELKKGMLDEKCNDSPSPDRQYYLKNAQEDQKAAQKPTIQIPIYTNIYQIDTRNTANYIQSEPDPVFTSEQQIFSIKMKENNQQLLSITDNFTNQNLAIKQRSQDEIKNYLQNVGSFQVRIDSVSQKKSSLIISEAQKQNVTILSQTSDNKKYNYTKDEKSNTKQENKLKSSGCNGSPSSSMFGLKKVYSSPKTNGLIVPAEAISTSAFTTNHDFKFTKKQSPSNQKVGYLNSVKPYQRHMKIETVAYSYNLPKKQEEKPAIAEQSQEFQFDF